MPGASHAFISIEYPAFAARVQQQRQRLIELLKRIVDRVEPGTANEVLRPLEQALAAKAGGKASSGSDLSELYDFLDRLRESAETFIDEAKGQHSSQQVAVVQGQLAAASSAAAAAGAGAGGSNNYRNRMPVAKNLLKPQLAFEDGPIDNSRDTAFVPRVGMRYHGSASSSSSSGGVAASAHPYHKEITNMGYQPWQLQRADPPAAFARLDDVECMLVNTPAGLAHMMDYLEGSTADVRNGCDVSYRLPFDPVRDRQPVKEVAIDLEAHSLRSFQGFTCLLQLSSRGRDFLVDTLALRSHMGLLNRITTDPAVVKVLHGCDSDVVWLQRDFGVYLVNVFDTGQAARVLAYPSFGLAFLLQRFANVTANKEYQTADWRERPLPAPLLKYAREDTHYLLGIYDRVKNDLIDRSAATSPVPVAAGSAGKAASSVTSSVDAPNLLAAVLERSKEKTLAVYEKEAFEPGAYRRLMVRMGLKPTAASLSSSSSSSAAAAPATPSAAVEDDGDDAAADGSGDAPTPSASAAAGGGEDTSSSSSSSAPPSPRTCAFAAIYDWRDAVARSEDESTHYVLPNRLLARLAELRPGSVDALIRACNPIPPLLRVRAAEVVQVIVASKAGAAALAGASAAAGAASTAGELAQQRLAGVKRPASAMTSSSLSGGDDSSAATQPPPAKKLHSVSLAVTVEHAAPPSGGWLSAPAVGQDGVPVTRSTVVMAKSSSALVGAFAAGGRSEIIVSQSKSSSASVWANDDEDSAAPVSSSRASAVRVASSSASAFADSDDSGPEEGDDPMTSSSSSSSGVPPPAHGASLAAQIRASMAAVSLLELLGVTVVKTAPVAVAGAADSASAVAAATSAAADGSMAQDDGNSEEEAEASAQPTATSSFANGLPDTVGGNILSLDQRYKKQPSGDQQPRKPREPKQHPSGTADAPEGGTTAAPAFSYSSASAALSGGAAASAASMREANEAEARKVRQHHGSRGGRGGHRGGRGRGGGGGGGNPYMKR